MQVEVSLMPVMFILLHLLFSNLLLDGLQLHSAVLFLDFELQFVANGVGCVVGLEGADRFDLGLLLNQRLVLLGGSICL